jgi:UDPglucose--hexose-1-phosphate uridylyltransferase
MFDMMNGVGAHEVIVESPDHQWEFSESPLHQIREVLIAYRERIIDLQGDKRFRYTLVFRNYGLRAGASLAHPHSQLISIAVMPRRVKDELKAAKEYFVEKERCIFCDIITQELELNKRVVAENEHFVALSPFAARFPYELNILPRQHCHDFTRMSDEETWGLAHVMRNVLKRVRTALNNPAYNFMLHTSPYPIPRPGRPDYWGTIEWDFHWHIEIVPRLTRVAGFEWGTGFYINPVAPEASTQVLRDLQIEIKD